MRQFVAHINRYTGRRYAVEPAIVAVQLINRPIYPPETTDQQITEYIDALAEAVRSAGAQQPILYNGLFYYSNDTNLTPPRPESLAPHHRLRVVPNRVIRGHGHLLPGPPERRLPALGGVP